MNSLNQIKKTKFKVKIKPNSSKNKIRLRIIERVSNPEIPNLLKKADIFVITSKYEGLPQAVIEAFSCGLPVIGTNVRGINDIVRHNYNGILCDEDPEEIAKAIKSLITDKEKYTKLRKNAIKSAEVYHFDKIMDKIYKNIKGKR